MKPLKPPRPLVTLKDPQELERICKGLAALDAIVCEDRESRAYSFDAAWSVKKKLRLASMRNGSGDDWFLVFATGGAFFKSFWHEYPRGKPEEIYEGLGASLEPQLREPAFSMDAVTFGGFFDGAKWTLRGNPKPLAGELPLLDADAAAYCAYARAVFEVDLPEAVVAHVLAGKSLDTKLVARLSDQRTLAELKADLAEIGYGKA